jgi:hypothetical protein
MYRLVITVWNETVKDEERIYKEKSVSELKAWVTVLLLLLHLYVVI